MQIVQKSHFYCFEWKHDKYNRNFIWKFEVPYISSQMIPAQHNPNLNRSLLKKNEKYTFQWCYGQSWRIIAVPFMWRVVTWMIRIVLVIGFYIRCIFYVRSIRYSTNICWINLLGEKTACGLLGLCLVKDTVPIQCGFFSVAFASKWLQ